MGETQNTGAATNPTGRDELVERVARAIDPDAWDAIDDGRDIPGTFWHIRRDIARERGRAALTTIEASRNDGVAINAMSDVREALAKLVQDAYEEGVEDGIEAAAAPHLRDVAVPQWIDSVARIELLKFAALESLSGGGK